MTDRLTIAPSQDGLKSWWTVFDEDGFQLTLCESPTEAFAFAYARANRPEHTVIATVETFEND